VGFKLTTLVVIGTDCIGSCKSNYHTITTTMAHLKIGDVFIFYHIVLIGMLDFKNSIWLLFCTRTLSYGMSIVDLTVNISQ